jgi:beta-glucanase (GH16 family)
MPLICSKYCLLLEDNFQTIDTGVWNYEIQRGGFGSGSFEWTTDDPKNAYVDAEGLHIVPTLTTESTDITLEQLTDNFVLNLTTDGTCTAKEIDSCSVRSNLTAGTIINPVRSARLSTKGKKTLRYGKVEVVAKMPKGDWLWPAIWMMPEADIYGQWPRSGEIDIAESRGNSGDNYTDGRDSLIGALHWGPIAEKDAFYKTSGKHNLRRTDYSEAFHTYGLEWSENYLFTYIDSRLLVSVSPTPSHLHSLTTLTASFLRQIQSELRQYVGTWRIWKDDCQQLGPFRSLVPDRQAQYAFR